MSKIMKQLVLNFENKPDNRSGMKSLGDMIKPLLFKFFLNNIEINVEI